MNELFQDYTLSFIKIYLDDIVAHSKSFEEHLQHLRKAFDILRKNKLYAKRSKCSFCKSSIEYCGYIVSSKGITTQLKKIQAIKDWPTPTNVADIRSFLGLCGFYHKFIKNFAKLTLPISELLKKETKFKWSDECQQAFEKIKEEFQKANTLAFPDPDKAYLLYTDASDHAIGATLNQLDDHGNLALLACFSKKLGPAEINYGAHEKELMALIQALTYWRHYLLGASQGCTCFTDSTAVSWIFTHPKLSRRQARWLELLEEFMPSLTVKHIKGATNAAADALA
jgi:ribonuclease HI